MRYLITSLLLLPASIVIGQTYLYNESGISLSYTTSVEKTVLCKKENKTVYFIKLHYTISNNSVKSVRISSRLQMCADAFAECPSEDEVTNFNFFGTGRASLQDNNYFVLKSGESYYGDVGNWYYKTTASPCAWNISPEFPKAESTLKVNIDLNPTSTQKNNTKPTYDISQQGDVIHNPNPQVNNIQKQQEENKATDNAMKAWQNSYQDNQNQINKLNSIPNKYQLQPTQQEQEIQRQKQIAAQQKLNEIQQQLAEQHQRYQQTQIELDNAKNVSMNAYQAAINSGRKESGAMLDATLAGAQQISDATGQLVYTGVGLGISLFVHLAEKKAEKKEVELAAKREEEERLAELNRKKLIIQTKDTYIKEALDINKYSFSDLVSKDRYAAILLVPKSYEAGEQNIYFSSPLQILKYSDETYPLKPEIEKKLLSGLDKSITDSKKVYTLYPITNPERFMNDFVKKMGSGKVIYLNAALLNYIRNPYTEAEEQDQETDFWGNPKKEEKKNNVPEKKQKSFWDQ